MIRLKLSLGNLFVFSESWPSFILLRVARTVGSHLALALPGTFTPSVTRILWLGQPKYSPFKILNCWRKIWPLIQWMILITGAEQIFLAYSSLHVWLETSWFGNKLIPLQTFNIFELKVFIPKCYFDFLEHQSALLNMSVQRPYRNCFCESEKRTECWQKIPSDEKAQQRFFMKMFFWKAISSVAYRCTQSLFAHCCAIFLCYLGGEIIGHLTKSLCDREPMNKRIIISTGD